ncbi:MAG: NAD(P)-binding protein, partial [Desulfobacterales bacterium]
MASASVNPIDVNRLPHHLSERVHVIRNAPSATSGEFVLYWMHHAVRSHENPALDTALYAAALLNLPLLVYQGLGGRHPFNSDRHHTFIMEGAREVQQELQDRGISYAFYLGRRPNEPSPINSLAQRATLIIAEDFPAPPLARWTRQLAEQVDAAVWAVDCACIIPMRLIRPTFNRAYAFRNHTQEEYERRLPRVWDDVTAAVEPFEGKYSFEGIDFANADIAELCARCEIDHTIPPVAHTRGGSTAGYARWEKFKQHGLRSYNRLRNDAAVVFPKGVSRMSAYLHHGQVSPLRIARDAARDGSAGAIKFLDEILIWRELAHHFCLQRQNLSSLDAIPQWARQSLIKHQDDLREAIYSWERLYRGQTGDALWDAAQKSLLIHGELHNNVRMTWGKAILNWVQHPQDALDLMIDLNHRFALDGNDPNSYGGLLWCLGLFDRPFKPERPVIGTLRPRSTKDHAKRLNMAAYAAKIKGPVLGEPLSIAVIGGGLSGLFAARTLRDHGHYVQVFEKTNRPGGRTATQTDSTYAFDTGAQYFTARDERFRRYVKSWQMDGIVQPWKGKVQVIKKGRLTDEKQLTERWVGIPAMDAIAAHLATEIEIASNVTVASATTERGRWQLFDQHHQIYGPYDAVIVAVPPPQAARFLKSCPELFDRVAMVKMQPCLAVMAVFEKPLDLPFDAAFIHQSPLRWAAKNNSKPRRPEPECWVFHANAEWSQTVYHRNDDKTAGRSLLVRFFESIGRTFVEPIDQRFRYWQSAAAINPLSVGCLWDAE